MKGRVTCCRLIAAAILLVAVQSCDPILDQTNYNALRGYATGLTFANDARRVRLTTTRAQAPVITPAGADVGTLAWSSSDPTVATVDATGVVTPLKLGTTTIRTVSDLAALDASYSVTVIVADGFASLDMQPALELIDYGTTSGTTSTAQLDVSFDPASAPDKSLIWSTSDATVATVSAGLVSAVAPGVARIRATSTADSSSTATCLVTVMQPITAYDSTAYNRKFSIDLGTVVDVRYSRALDRIVAISSSPPSIKMANPLTGAVVSLNLPATPLSMAIGPNGLSAVVGYDGSVGVYALAASGATATHVWPVTKYSGIGENQGQLGSVVLDRNGWIWAIDSRDQWIKLRRISAATGAESLVNGLSFLYAGSQALLQPGHDAFYYVDTQLNPSSFYHVDISNPSAASLPEYYVWDTGVFPFWFYDDGSRIIGANKVFSLTGVESTDMREAGTLPSPYSLSALSAADHCTAAGGMGKGLIIASYKSYWEWTLSDKVQVVDGATFSTVRRILLPQVSRTAEHEVCWYLFWNAAGSEFYALARAPGVTTGAFDLLAY